MRQGTQHSTQHSHTVHTVRSGTNRIVIHTRSVMVLELEKFPTRPACVFKAWCYRSGRATVKYPGYKKNAHTQKHTAYAGLCTRAKRIVHPVPQIWKFCTAFFTVCAYCSHAVNTAMLVRVVVIYALLTVCAIAGHENTYAVFELREQLLRLTLNIWELLDQLQYASESLRQRVYLDMAMIQSEIASTIAELLRLDSLEHPRSK